MTDDEKNEVRASINAFTKVLGIDRDRTYISIPDERYPDHLFRIGYFRSSYNEAGINNVLRDLFGISLYDIFDVEDGHEYYIKPDWNRAKEKVQDVIKKLTARIESGDDYKCLKLEHADHDKIASMFHHSENSTPRQRIASTKEAIDTLIAEKIASGSQGSYSNRHGEFFMKPIHVYGLLRGESPSMFDDKIKNPCTYVVYKYGDEKASTLSWYLEALHIVETTIDYVLAKPEEEQSEYVFIWSA
jgi:hypothetical protein